MFRVTQQKHAEASRLAGVWGEVRETGSSHLMWEEVQPRLGAQCGARSTPYPNHHQLWWLGWEAQGKRGLKFWSRGRGRKCEVGRGRVREKPSSVFLLGKVRLRERKESAPSNTANKAEEGQEGGILPPARAACVCSAEPPGGHTDKGTLWFQRHNCRAGSVCRGKGHSKRAGHVGRLPGGGGEESTVSG